MHTHTHQTKNCNSFGALYREVMVLSGQLLQPLLLVALPVQSAQAVGEEDFLEGGKRINYSLRNQ
jgi:hypothetical protein